VSDELEIEAGLLPDLDGDGTPDGCQPLSADSVALGVLAGGTVEFTLNGGAPHAAELYLLLGTLSGTTPGFDLGATHVPLVQDAYFGFSLAHPGVAPLLGSFGVLDGAGAGAAQFQLAPGFSTLVGKQAHHAWLALDATTLAVTLVSNALPLDFNP
jgi:hypothetical protein